jgi:two-component system sensor histidine kinase YesM
MKKRWMGPIKRILSGRLRNKLVFAFSFIVVFIVILLSYLSFRQTTNINAANFIDSSQKILKLVNQNLDSYVDQIDELSLSPRKDAQFMDALLSNEYLGQFYIQNQIKNLFYSRDDIEEISIYTPLDHQLYRISRSTVNLTQELDTQTPNEPWYQQAAHSPNFRSMESAWYRHKEGETSNFLIFHRILINISDKRPLAAISITLNQKQFSRITRDITEKPEEFIGLFGDSNEPFFLKGLELSIEDQKDLLAHMDKQSENSRHTTWKKDHTNYLMIYNNSAQSKWRLIELTPMDLLNQSAAKARQFNLLVGSGLVIFFIAVIIVVSNAITRRLKNFSRRIDQLGEGNFELDYEIRGSDEIANLSRKFNQMVVRINDLIAERYEIKINERDARLRALESQINPHFLYNSLQAISTEAIINDMDSIHHMVDALASSLRYCIKEGETVKVADELEHIHNYLLLQKARFGSRLNVEFAVSDEVLDGFIPKMSLQILLENSIEHALEQMSEAIHITIEAYASKDFMVLKVSDDGPGIASERFHEIMESLDDNYFEYDESIGLKNLYSRLKLRFGNEATLTIRSEYKQGTEVEIGLPLRKDFRHV